VKPRARCQTGQNDLFKARLDQIIDLGHELVLLARTIDWAFLEAAFGTVHSDVPGQPPLPVRLMAGLAILKHTYNLSDEALAARWVENPYFQYFCGEEFFQHKAPFDRSSMTRWRQRMGEEKLATPIQESLAAAVKTKAMRLSDLSQAIVDTTVQEKAIAFPTDAKLCHRLRLREPATSMPIHAKRDRWARERLVRLAKRHGVRLRQSYARVGKFALIKHQRYAHARQFKRARRSLRTLKTYPGRVMRDIERAIRRQPGLNALFRRKLYPAGRVLSQKRSGRGRKVYSLHAPEVDASAKARRTSPSSSGSRLALRPRLGTRPEASAYFTPRRCLAIPMTGTPLPLSSPPLRKPPVLRYPASWPMPAVAATTRRHPTKCGSTSRAKNAA
jgi:transposase, IS5 family